MSEEQNGWNEWSKHVLNELHRLNVGQESIREDIHNIRIGMSKVTVMETQLEEIKVWKDNVSEVTTPTQLKELIVKVDDLQTFKAKAITFFVLVQLAVTIGLAVFK